MREKKWYYVISFETTSEAMRTEAYCESKHLPGRIIPLPKEISAGCGLAWRVPLEDSQELLENFKEAGIAHGAGYEMLL